MTEIGNQNKGNKVKRKNYLGSLLFFVAVLVVVVWNLWPFVWQFITSIKPSSEIFAMPPTIIPSKVTFSSYVKLFEIRDFGQYMINSLIVAFASTGLCLFCGSLCAYALARFKLFGGSLLERIFLVLSFLPGIIFLIPLFPWFRELHLINKPLALTLPYTAFNLPFAIFTLKAAFAQIPKEIEEAAWIDGFSMWGVFSKILLPLTAPSLVACGTLVFIFAWNEFLYALAFLMKDASRTIPVGIAMLSGSSMYEVPWDQISAAVVLATLPVVALVLIFQRRILQDLTQGAVKG
ncbi:carbohydrate ABC transporter permease [Elusimicrobiota bacterium]